MYYFLGVGYPATDLNVSTSGIELPGFLVNYQENLKNKMFWPHGIVTNQEYVHINTL